MKTKELLKLIDEEISKIEFEYEECLKLIGSSEESDSINLIAERFKKFKRQIIYYENN